MEIKKSPEQVQEENLKLLNNQIKKNLRNWKKKNRGEMLKDMKKQIYFHNLQLSKIYKQMQESSNLYTKINQRREGLKNLIINEDFESFEKTYFIMRKKEGEV